MQPSRNIAARAARWSARHKRITILGWFAFVIAAFMLGGATGTEQLDQNDAGVRDSGLASKIHNRAYPKDDTEMVLVSSKKHVTSDPQFKSTVAQVVSRLRATKGVRHIQDPYRQADGSTIAKNHRLALVSFEVPGSYLDDPEVKAIVDKTVTDTKAQDRGSPDFLIEPFGDGSSEKDFQKIFSEDLSKAGSLSLPLTLGILLLTFGTLWAAGVPLLLAVTSVMATFGLIGPISQAMPVEESIQHVILLIGLAVGVDYSLFYVRRLREERAAGRSAEEALEAAAATSGRAVLISGLTVITSMAGMYLAGSPTFTSFATGSILVVAVAMLASLTVLPAVLSSLGDRIERTRVPGLRGLKRRFAGAGLWSKVVDGVMRRPLLAAVASGGLLITMAIPAVGMEIGQPEMADSLPKDKPVVQTFNRLRDAFPTETSAMTIVVKADDVTKPAITGAITRLKHETAARKDLFPEPNTTEVDISPDHSAATISLELSGNGSDKASNRALDELRGGIVPDTIGRVDGAHGYVDGETAQVRDFNEQMKSTLPFVFGFVMLAAFGLLLVTFRSLIVPLKAIVLNLLSVGAAYGAMVMVFQHGWLKGLLGFQSTGPITSWLPMFLFVVLFGLSMDYHVFILSRVKELVDRGVSTEEAVSTSLKSTASTVTSAAVVMVGVFSLFGSLSFLEFKQMGVGLAFAVLLDATLIRGVLLPASMKLLGSRNWWLPSSLSWLPEIRHEGEVVPVRS